MTKYALYVPLEAKPGKEKEVADFLRSTVPLVNADTDTQPPHNHFVSYAYGASGKSQQPVRQTALGIIADKLPE